jgi:hypothetical protein
MRCFVLRERVWGLGVCALICALCQSCGGEAPPELFPVSGRVTYQGKPVPGAKVMFFLDAKENLKQPSPERPYGEADDDGNYELAWGEGEGAPEGKYKVSIMALKPYGPEDDTELKPPSLIPEKYQSPASSGLTAVVKDGDNVVNFELVD